MALPGADVSQPERHHHHHDRVYALSAVAAGAAAVAFWIVEVSLGHDTYLAGLSDRLWWVAGVLVVAWLVATAERRIVDHLSRIENDRYRDGYADGYVDAASRRLNGYDRPTLRPVK